MSRGCFAALLVVVFLMSPGMATVVDAQRCMVDIVVQNRNRLVDGEVSAECNFGHTRPFGNWGVRLNHPAGKFRDGYQFSGWKADDGWLQWNSCTTDPRYAPGNELYYNDDMFRSQRAQPDVLNVSHAVKAYYIGQDATACIDLSTPRVVVVDDVRLGVYELDKRLLLPPSGELVAELSYGTITVEYECETLWECSGESKWIEPVSGHDTVSADIRLAVRLRREDPNEE